MRGTAGPRPGPPPLAGSGAAARQLQQQPPPHTPHAAGDKTRWWGAEEEEQEGERWCGGSGGGGSTACGCARPRPRRSHPRWWHACIRGCADWITGACHQRCNCLQGENWQGGRGERGAAGCGLWACRRQQRGVAAGRQAAGAAWGGAAIRSTALLGGGHQAAATILGGRDGKTGAAAWSGQGIVGEAGVVAGDARGLQVLLPEWLPGGAGPVWAGSIEWAQAGSIGRGDGTCEGGRRGGGGVGPRRGGGSSRGGRGAEGTSGKISQDSPFHFRGVSSPQTRRIRPRGKGRRGKGRKGREEPTGGGRKRARE